MPYTLDQITGIGEGAENLEPVAKLMERLLRVFGRAKAARDQGQLPPPEEKKQLLGPNAEKRGPAEASEPDDEIPF